MGADIAKVQTKGGHEVWSSSSRTCVQNAIKVVEKLLEDDGEGKKLRSPGKAKNPFPTGHQAVNIHTDDLREMHEAARKNCPSLDSAKLLQIISG